MPTILPRSALLLVVAPGCAGNLIKTFCRLEYLQTQTPELDRSSVWHPDGFAKSMKPILMHPSQSTAGDCVQPHLSTGRSTLEYRGPHLHFPVCDLGAHDHKAAGQGHFRHPHGARAQNSECFRHSEGLGGGESTLLVAATDGSAA